jgi:hypothetical protein
MVVTANVKVSPPSSTSLQFLIGWRGRLGATNILAGTTGKLLHSCTSTKLLRWADQPTTKPWARLTTTSTRSFHPSPFFSITTGGDQEL